MEDWIDREVEIARARVGVQGHPTEADLLKLTEILGVRIVHAPVAVSSCVCTECGPVITLPSSWRGEEDDFTLAHECGHAFTNPGGGSLLRFLWPDCPRVARLARLWDRRDEQYADRFVKAWFRR